MKLTFAMLLFTLMLGCASAPLTDEEIYAREEARLLRKENVLRYIKGCKAAGGVLVSTTRAPVSVRDQRWKRKRVEDLTIDDISIHMRVIDFQCGAPGEVLRSVF